MIKRFFVIPLLLIALSVFFTSCATSGSAGGSSKTYSEDYRTMISTVEQAIRSSRLSIQEMHENEEETKYEFIFSERVNYGGEIVNGKIVRAIVEKVNDKEATVKVINPNYHFTVPNDQRQNYRRMLLEKVDDLLKQS
ncbi:MAG: hypothetical protein RI564_05190 [Gracilimonas sp.]|nr:hypothetical protein [Gracilimonas sp.]